MSSFKAPSKSQDRLPDLYITSSHSARKNAITLRSLKVHAEAAWLSILRSPALSMSLRKEVLRNCTTTILPWLLRPETLMDFLTDSYNIGGSTSLLALSGLFYLINSKNLDYPSFFRKLYSLLDNDLLHGKHRSRFFRLLDTFLSSSHLPVSLVASFIKRLSRLALFAPPAAIVVIVPYIYNLLKSHPTCTFMIHRIPHPPNLVSGDKVGEDPFNMSEPDPLLTHAIESSLWELETLQSHYHPNVASVARIISEQFTKQQYNLEDFLDHGYTGMVDSELGKEPKKEPVVEWMIPKHIFTDASGVEPTGERSLLMQLWTFGQTEQESFPRAQDHAPRDQEICH